jgi:hypothetical protein
MQLAGALKGSYQVDLRKRLEGFHTESDLMATDAQMNANGKNVSKNATIEAKPESTQDPSEKEVLSIRSGNCFDDQSQFAPAPGDSWRERIPILSCSAEQDRENDRNEWNPVQRRRHEGE